MLYVLESPAQEAAGRAFPFFCWYCFSWIQRSAMGLVKTLEVPRHCLLRHLLASLCKGASPAQHRLQACPHLGGL